ncbi:MAG: J domain-containing protein, partial [Thermomicrobiales bacterium]
SREEITRAYRALMRLTHPDNFVEPDQRAKAEERAKLINAAYSVLSKPEIRSAYDAQMRTTVVSDALMQRYTGNTPGHGAQARPRSQPASARTARAQRKAHRSAVLQILLVTSAFAGSLIVIIAASYLTWQMITSVL